MAKYAATSIMRVTVKVGYDGGGELCCLYQQLVHILGQTASVALAEACTLHNLA